MRSTVGSDASSIAGFAVNSFVRSIVRSDTAWRLCKFSTSNARETIVAFDISK